ncbi:MAG TPA: C_GCAxxG_C_C family protein [Clostridiaceae bacterium]|nr:C_GCAxxG_C_C family protein [Clostridiaceae bacterium]
MLKDLIIQDFGKKEDLNCAEKILQGANIVYSLGLDKESLKLASGFGGGMGIEDKCGALTAAIMVLGKMFVSDRAHESDRIKRLTRKLFAEFNKEMSSIDCAPLKKNYRSEKYGCKVIIVKAAEILDRLIEEEKN